MTQFRRDIHRLLSVPAPWILLALESAFAVGTSGSMKLLGAAPSPAVALGFLPAFAGVFGAVSAGADFRFGAVPGEVLVLGGPLRYFQRTFAAISVVGAVGGVIGAAFTAGTLTLLRDPALTPARVGLLTIAGLLAGACWALIGAVVAVAVRSQIGSVASMLAYLMFVEPVLEVSAKSVDWLLPGHIAIGMFSQDSLAAVGATAYPLVVLAVVLAAAICVFVRRREIAVTTS